MSDAHGIARDQLRAFIERIERLEEEKKSIADDIKDVYGEAKSMGFDAKILRKVISIRKQDADERAEQEAILDTYLQALGMIQFDMFEEPEAETSAKLVAQVATGLQTQAGRAALLTAVDIMIERQERFDAETGEILDDAPRSDGGLNIVTKHTEIATASQGGTASPSAEAEAPGANAGGEDVDRSAERANINAVASASGPDEKRASNSPEQAPEFLTKAEEEAEAKGAVTVDTVSRANEESDRQRASGAGPADGRQHGGGDPLAAAGDHAPSFIAKPKYVLRPNCQNPEACGGYGANHCHPCQKAMREKAEEVA
ncbi:DUF2312 domain-containing protein [Sinorhizobium meliloti]|nr:DUF2312 domain-containing protein [Sinorhizobium meliloti]